MLPIGAPGAFHPKLCILVGPKKASILIGSHNLSLSWFGYNDLHVGAFCYHCGVYHPIEDMRQIPAKGSKKRRCKKSIEATKQGREAREAFGRDMTAINKADAQAVKNRMVNPERNRDK